MADSPSPLLSRRAAGVGDVLVLGHYDVGFGAHHAAMLARGERSGDYRNLRNDFVTIEGQPASYLEVLNRVSDREFHWTEMLGTAVAVICSYLARQGVSAVPGTFYPPRRAELDALLESGFPVVALTSTLYLDPAVVEEAVAYVRQRAPNAVIVVGGPFVENLHHNLAGEDLSMVLEDVGADVYVLERQGEKTLLAIVQAALAGTGFEAIPNCLMPRRELYELGSVEAENLPLAASAIDWRLFRDQTIQAAVQTRTAFGCPFKCTFCDYPIRAGGKWKSHDLETIERELAEIDARGQVTDVVFIDDTFNFPIQRFAEILRMMVRRGFRFRWYSYFRCNLATPELVALMKASNCGGVFLGIESADDHVLDIMKKNATVAEYSRGIALLNDAGIPSFASIIVGFPGETKDSIDHTIEFLNRTKPTFYRGEIWYYNHRSPIHQQAEEFAIEGNGYRFRHATMDWQEACDQAVRLFAGVTGSTWLPMYDVDFWSLPYLRSCGLSLEQIQRWLALCNELLAIELELPGPHRPRAAIEQDLAHLGSAVRDQGPSSLGEDGVTAAMDIA